MNAVDYLMAGITALVGWLYWDRQKGEQDSTPDVQNVKPVKFQPPSMLGWQPPISAQPYLSALHAAEQRNNMPHNLLVRVAYQESRFRADIISGKTVSSAGALGIMQIVPKWHPSANPLDPYAAIDYAAGYLAQLRRQFGTWEMALAAYNWGPGNVQTYGLGKAPKETRDYVAQIGRDVKLT